MHADNQFHEFMTARSLRYTVAFSGGSEESEDKILPIITEAIEILSKYPVAIVNGGTIWSIQKASNTVAKAYGMPTIGVLPKRGVRYLNQELDLALIVEPQFSPSEWSDDSEVFIKCSSAVIMIGGGYGTLVELAHLLKINESRLAHPDEGKPIYLAPIAGLGGVSDQFWPLIKDPSRKVLPKELIYTGKQAADFIVEKLQIA